MIDFPRRSAGLVGDQEDRGVAMKVIICGAGQVGWQIARHLSGENNDVTVIDNDPDLVRRATDTLDVRVSRALPPIPMCWNARARGMPTWSSPRPIRTRSTWSPARWRIRSLRCRARSRGCARKAISTAIYSDLYRRDHLPIDVVISPEREVAEAALRRLAAPATFDTESFLDDEVRLIGIALDADCPILNTPLRNCPSCSRPCLPWSSACGASRRCSRRARGSALCRRSDLCLTLTRDFGRTLEIFGKPTQRQERVIIVGGGNVGLAVARDAGTAAGPDAGEASSSATAPWRNAPPTRWNGRSCCMATGSTWSCWKRRRWSGPMPS
jgi:trk system potassium uptake protein TrkA